MRPRRETAHATAVVVSKSWFSPVCAAEPDRATLAAFCLLPLTTARPWGRRGGSCLSTGVNEESRRNPTSRRRKLLSPARAAVNLPYMDASTTPTDLLTE